MKPKTKKILMLSGLALGGLTMFLIARRQQAASSGATLVASASPIPSATTSNPATSTPTSTTTQPSQPAVQRVSNYPEGTLLRYGNNDKIFVIDAMGYRHYISSRSYFDMSGYKMSDVKSITLDQMIAIPEGSRLGGMNGLSNNPLFI